MTFRGIPFSRPHIFILFLLMDGRRELQQYPLHDRKNRGRKVAAFRLDLYLMKKRDICVHPFRLAENILTGNDSEWSFISVNMEYRHNMLR